MLQEDSNGEGSFEIIDKKVNELSNNGDKTESLSSVSSAYSIPSPSIVNLPSGNLLSNVAPPSQLPDFTLWPSSTAATPNVSSNTTVSAQPTPITNINPVQVAEQFPTTTFSAAIPPSKGIPIGPVLQPTSNETDSLSGSGIMGLVKEAFSSGGVLSKMAEKAKNSVDSIITTLDPQMSEYIYSTGDTEVTVTSDNEEEVSAIREAFHSVFGKAWVNGIKLNMPPKMSECIGFEEGFKSAEEKLDYSLKYRSTPTISTENIISQIDNNWYGFMVLILKDTEKNITIKTFTQPTLIPLNKILKQIDNERPDYKTYEIDKKLATYLKTSPGWKQNISGVSDKEIIVLAAKTLVRIYKNELLIKKT